MLQALGTCSYFTVGARIGPKPALVVNDGRAKNCRVQTLHLINLNVSSKYERF
jgi:hypothetical protein